MFGWLMIIIEVHNLYGFNLAIGRRKRGKRKWLNGFPLSCHVPFDSISFSTTDNGPKAVLLSI